MWRKPIFKPLYPPANCRILYAHQPYWTSPTLTGYLCLSVPSVRQCVCPNNFTVHTKWIFFCSISKWLQKHDIKGSVFTVLSPCFFLFLPCSLSCALWRLKVAQSLRTLLIHTNDCPLFDVIENACTSRWKEWKKKSKDGKPEVENQLSWNGTTALGEGKHCAHWGTELLWRGGERGAHVLGLYQRILNSYINYLGNIAWKIIDGPVFNTVCLNTVCLKFSTFYGFGDILVGFGVSFSADRSTRNRFFFFKLSIT